jgi:predicted amidohydrolase
VDLTVIAVAQLAIAIGELDTNRKAAAAAVAEAAAAKAALVVLPELCDSGYVFGAVAVEAQAEAGALASPADDSDTLRQWHTLAAEHQLVIVGGFCERGADGRLYNSAALVDASGTRAVYRKAHLWDKEKLVFTPGDAPPPVVDTAVGRVAVMICYDLEFPEWVRLAAINGADLIAAPVNWPYAARPAGERPAEVIKAQAAAATNGGLRRGRRPLSGRARRVLDQRLADRRPGRLPAGRPGAAGPARRADRHLRSSEGQGQEPGRRQRPARRPPPQPVHAARTKGRAGGSGERPLGGALHRERDQLLRLPGHDGAHHGLG